MRTRHIISYGLFLLISGKSFAEGRLARCTIESDENDHTTVDVENYPDMPADEQHFTELSKKSGYVYEFAQTYDGSKLVGIGKGK